MLTEWFKSNKLSLNLDKMVAMKFWNFDIIVDGIKIPLVAHMKFLGVHLDNDLSWNIHLNQVTDKIQTNKRMLSLGRNPLDTNCMKNIYYGHIHSHPIYAITAWGSMATQAQLEELRNLQKQCIWIKNETSPSSDITGQFEKLRILRLDELITLNLCKLGHKISHGNHPKPIAQIFNLSGG